MSSSAASCYRCPWCIRWNVRPQCCKGSASHPFMVDASASSRWHSRRVRQSRKAGRAAPIAKSFCAKSSDQVMGLSDLVVDSYVNYELESD